MGSRIEVPTSFFMGIMKRLSLEEIQSVYRVLGKANVWPRHSIESLAKWTILTSRFLSGTIKSQVELRRKSATMQLEGTPST